MKCDKCGLCCKSLNLNPIYEDLHNGDGICKYLNLSTNFCNIYESRPIMCNIELAYNIYFSNLYSKKEFYKLNSDMCFYLKGRK